MGKHFQKLKAQKQLIENVIKEEENSFLRTLEQGLILLNRIVEEVKDLILFLARRLLNYMTLMVFLLI